MSMTPQAVLDQSKANRRSSKGKPKKLNNLQNRLTQPEKTIKTPFYHAQTNKNKQNISKTHNQK